jgi:DNA-binding GntR family transcriptional regulator
MREATRILSLEGLLKRSIHRGVAVSQLSLKDVKEIYHLRRMLEIPAVLAADSGHSDVLPEMQDSLVRIRGGSASAGLGSGGEFRLAVPGAQHLLP